MGLAASAFMGNGNPTTYMTNLITGSLFNSFINKDTENFEEFHVAFLDIFNTFNSALPGKHYDVPSHSDVQKCYQDWKNVGNNDDKRKEIFVNFIKDKVGLNKPDSITVVTGLVTPPAAMAAKKAGERVPALRMTKVVPDVLFVPSVTFLALISVKVSKNVLRRRMVNRDQQIGVKGKGKESEGKKTEENKEEGGQQKTEKKKEEGGQHDTKEQQKTEEEPKP